MILLAVEPHRWRRVALLTAVAALIMATEVEVPHVSSLALALTAVWLVAWIGRSVVHHPAWVVPQGGAALALEAVKYGQGTVAAVVGIIFTLIYLGALPPR